MRTSTYHDVRGYDQAHGTDWIGAIREVCEKHAIAGQGVGVFAQFKTDWVSKGIVHAIVQTLQYVGFGYEDSTVFKDIGGVVGRMFEAIES